MLEIDHDTLENREKMRGGRGEKRKIRQMFCLEAEQQIQADGIHIEGPKEKIVSLDKICTGVVKNQLHLFE